MASSSNSTISMIEDTLIKQSTKILNSNLDESKEYIEIKEGTASMFYDKNEEVFYNKVQVFNRDISIQVIRLFAEIRDKEQRVRYDTKKKKYDAAMLLPQSTVVDTTNHDTTTTNLNNNKNDLLKPPTVPKYGIHILDALAATGLRSVRYLKEIPGVRHVTINDLLPAATDAARITCEKNDVYDPSKVTIHTGLICACTLG